MSVPKSLMLSWVSAQPNRYSWNLNKDAIPFTTTWTTLVDTITSRDHNKIKTHHFPSNLPKTDR